MASSLSHSRDLQTLPNVGPAVRRRFERIGLTQIEQLTGRDPLEIFEEMCAAASQAEDPCLLDTVMSAIDQANGAPPKPWWAYTAERKQLLAAPSTSRRTG